MIRDARSTGTHRRPWRVGLLTAIVAVLWLAGTMPLGAQAQAPAAADSAEVTVDAAKLERLIATLEDADSRQAFLDKLKTLLAATRDQAPPAESDVHDGLFSGMEDRLRDLGGQLFAATRALGDLTRLAGWLSQQAGDAERRRMWIDVAIAVVAVLLAGLIAHRACGVMVARPLAKLEDRNAAGIVRRVTFAALRLVLRALPVAAFAGAAYAALLVAGDNEKARRAGLLVAQAYVVWALALLAARAVLSPDRPALRLVMIGDETANYLHIWCRRLVFTVVFGAALIKALAIVGLPEAGAQGLRNMLGILIAAMGIVLVLQNRREVKAWIRGEAGGTVRARLSDVWHILAIFYIAGSYAVWALSVAGGFGFLLRASVATAAIVVAASLATAGVGRALSRSFALPADIKLRYPTLEVRANRYVPLIHVAMRTAIFIVAVVALAEAWGLDSLAWLASPPGWTLIGGILNILAVLVVALVIWEAVSQAVESYLNGRDVDGNVITRGARARTLLPLIRNALLIALSVLVVLMVLSQIGVDIGPLLAGAGVVGLAIGFGSQKLVQDVITGAFMLFEDAIAVGDVVQVAGQAGVVEALSIRSIRLRDLSGSVHTVPFSAVDTVTNLTKEFSFAVFEIGVAYREDTDHVTEVLREIGAGMQEDPQFAPLIREPLEVLGVDQFADSAVIIKARFKTEPIKQWTVMREFNRRMKRRFDELGIEIPFPHQTVYFGVDRQGNAPPARVLVDRADAAPRKANRDGEQPEPGVTSSPPPPSPVPDPDPDGGTRT